MDIAVSICCTTYNQEKYIAQCLDGFLAQKTSFHFEIVIHDDASTDHTADIIRQYQQKYPEMIFPILQTENQFSKKVRIGAKWLYPRSRGKYIARCEGDDFWCDSNKLQSQYEAMEANPDCNLCVTRVQAVKENSEPLDKFYPNMTLSGGIIPQEDFIRYCLADFSFHLSSFMFRRDAQMDYVAHTPEFARISPVGDLTMALYYGQCGKVYFVNKVMSCYRLQAIGSWTSRQKEKSIEQKVGLLSQLQKTIVSFDNYTNYQYHGDCAKYLLKNEFAIHRLRGQCKELFSSRYKEIWNSLSLRTKMGIICQRYCFPLYRFVKKQ